MTAVLSRALALTAGWYATLTTRPLAAYGIAALRIGYGSLWTLYLLREYGERDAAWGPDALWSPALERRYAALAPWPGPLRAWDTALTGLSRTEFDLFYLLAIAVGAAFALGWHTRAVSVLFAFVVVAVENRTPVITDGGDNVLTLMSVYLVFTAGGLHWSLDERRRRSRQRLQPRCATEPGPACEDGEDGEDGAGVAAASWRAELGSARRLMVTLVHNGAVLVIAAQICVIYGTAGFLKVQGPMWQDGSALGYVLRLSWFQPWPGLSAWVAGHALILAVAGYATVIVQVGFPFIVFAPRLKYPALVVLLGMHLAIAVLMGLPFFSAAMLVGDAVFLPGRVWAAFGRRVGGPAYADAVNAIKPTLVYDGDCAFCSRSVRLATRWCRPAVRFVPWQTLDLGAHGLTERQVTTSVQWLPVGGGRTRAGAAAVARLLLRSRWPWRPVGLLMLVPPLSWLAALGYRLVAANRYRLPGGTAACAVPAVKR